MKFELEENNRGISDVELLDDMRRCAKAIGKDSITYGEYNEIGKTRTSIFRRRFGSWSRALELAGPQPTGWKRGITDEELFENVRAVWVRLGRQPSKSEVEEDANSHFSVKPYQTRFGSWTRAMRAFIAWINSDSSEQDEPGIAAKGGTAESSSKKSPAKRRPRREISERQRFRILVRDGFRCRACGASPLTTPGVELDVDHILPWSKGGETTDDNLETKCKQCNLGKGNAFDV